MLSSVSTIQLSLLFWGIPLFCGLLYLAVSDWLYYRLPNVGTYSLTGLGLTFAYNQHVASFIHHLSGAIIGYLVFFLIARCYEEVRKKQGLGLGDAKLMAVAGAWLSWQAISFLHLKRFHIKF